MSVEEDFADSASSTEQAFNQAQILPGDTYEEGPYLVFTAQYHLRRGSCCHSGCRHCPYEGQADK